MPDILAQFLENQDATQICSTTIVTPVGIMTITVSFEPWDDEGEDNS